MSADNPADTVTEQATEVIARASWEAVDGPGVPWEDVDQEDRDLCIGYSATVARALADAGLLADPVGRDERDFADVVNEAIRQKRRANDAITRAERAEAEVARLKAERCEHNKCPGGSLCCCQPNTDRAEALEAANAELRDTVEKVREIHQQHACTGYPDCMILFGGQCAHHGHCNHCRKTWPCPTIDALDGAGESDGE